MPKGKTMSAAATVEAWARNPDQSRTATLGAAMLAGQWQTRADAEALGGSPSLLGQAVAKLKEAGFNVEKQHAGGGQFRFRVRRRAANGTGRRSATVKREAAGVTHPQLGAVLTVRALALDEHGELVVHLTNGHAAWTATITGHVE